MSDAINTRDWPSCHRVTEVATGVYINEWGLDLRLANIYIGVHPHEARDAPGTVCDMYQSPNDFGTSNPDNAYWLKIRWVVKDVVCDFGHRKGQVLRVYAYARDAQGNALKRRATHDEIEQCLRWVALARKTRENGSQGESEAA